MNYLLDEDATVHHWKTPEGYDILFPVQGFMYGSLFNLRGGLQICRSPLMPSDGLMREYDSTETKGSEEPDKPKKSNTPSSLQERQFTFKTPWRHKLKVRVQEHETITYIRGRALTYTSELTNMNQRANMSFLPSNLICVATHQEPFRIQHSSHFSMARSQLKPRCEDFFLKKSVSPLQIQLERGTVEIRAGVCNGFYIWSAQPEYYVNIQPIMAERDECTLPMLGPNQSGKATTIISYQPKES